MTKKTNKKPAVPESNTSRTDLFLVSALLGAIILFGRGLNYDVLNFDDNEYFTNYPEILQLNFSSIKSYFIHYYVLMYQPLPILSISLTYAFFKTDPIAHHILNLIFHLANIFLVYRFVGKLYDKPIIKQITALLFAIHPLAVEPVLWISCRSSGMYAFFYLLGLMAFMDYKSTGRKNKLVFCYVWFACSLLSKAHAVTFPFAILLLDYLILKQRINKSFILNKIPFFLLSLAFGIIALLNKETIQNITRMDNPFQGFDYIFLLSYEMAWYFIKLLLPLQLAPIIVYPPLVDNMLPWIYYISPLFLVLLGFVLYKSWKAKPIIPFGFLFFYLLLSVSLQLVPSRLFIVADRYGYLPNVGLFFIMAYLFSEWKEGKINFLKNFEGKNSVLYVVVGGYFLLSFLQIPIWQNNATLADKIIDVNPETPYIAKAYGIRANYKKNIQNNVTEALKDYQSAARLDSNDWIAFYQSGLIYKTMGDTSSAFINFKKAHASNPFSPFSFTDMGVIFFEHKNYSLGIRLADSALKIKSTYPNAMNLKAVCLLNLGYPSQAEEYLSKAIAINPNYMEAIKNRAIVRSNSLNNKKGACDDFQRGANLGDLDCQRMVREYCGGF